MNRGEQATKTLLSAPVRHAILAARADSTCLLVGGVIRDQLIFDRVSHDWDLIVSAAPSFAQRLASHLGGRLVPLGGTRHSLFRVVSGKTQIDLQEPLVADLEGELRRRDLTVNSMALDLVDGTFHDPLSGLTDIDRQILRANSAAVFAADPLRVVRLFRFAMTLPEFTIEDGTAEWARRAAVDLQDVAVERVREELHRALSAPRAPRLGSLLVGLDLLPSLWSQGADTAGVLAGHVAMLDELDASVAAIERLIGRRIDPPDLEAMRHAALLLASGRAGERRAETRRLVSTGLLTKRIADRVARILTELDPPMDEAGRRRLIHLWGRSWPAGLALRRCVPPGFDRDGWRSVEAALAATAAHAGDSLFESVPLLTGHQLRQEFGVAPGAGMGRLIAALEEARVAGLISTPDEAREWLADGVGSAALRVGRNEREPT